MAHSLPSIPMADDRKPKQKTTPKGIDPKTGKPYEPVKRKTWDGLLRRAAKPERVDQRPIHCPSSCVWSTSLRSCVASWRRLKSALEFLLWLRRGTPLSGRSTT